MVSLNQVILVGKEGEHGEENEWDFYGSPNLCIPESAVKEHYIAGPIRFRQFCNNKYLHL